MRACAVLQVRMGNHTNLYAGLRLTQWQADFEHRAWFGGRHARMAVVQLGDGPDQAEAQAITRR